MILSPERILSFSLLRANFSGNIHLVRPILDTTINCQEPSASSNHRWTKDNLISWINATSCAASTQISHPAMCRKGSSQIVLEGSFTSWSYVYFLSQSKHTCFSPSHFCSCNKNNFKPLISRNDRWILTWISAKVISYFNFMLLYSFLNLKPKSKNDSMFLV